MRRPPIDTSGSQSARHNIFVLEGVAVGRCRNGYVLSDVDLNLPEKWCVGLYVKDGAAEKQALVDVLRCKLHPRAGKLTYPKKPKSGVNPNELIIITTPIMLATLCGAVALAWGMARASLEWYLCFAIGTIVVPTVFIIMFLWYEQQCEKRPPAIVHMIARGCDQWRPSPSKTVVQLITESLPSRIPKQDRPSRAQSLVKAADMGDKADIKFRDLSECEQQIVYILRCFVLRAKVLVCDEALRDLDIASQSRMLRMLRRMKQECSTSLLYLSSDMQQLSLISDSLGMLSNGKMCELGPAQEVLCTPRHPEMKEVIASSDLKTMMNSGIVEGSKNLHDFHNDLMKDSALGAMWLPKQID